jgi:transposase-like protein
MPCPDCKSSDTGITEHEPVSIGRMVDFIIHYRCYKCGKKWTVGDKKDDNQVKSG